MKMKKIWRSEWEKKIEICFQIHTHSRQLHTWNVMNFWWCWRLLARWVEHQQQVLKADWVSGWENVLYGVWGEEWRPSKICKFKFITYRMNHQIHGIHGLAYAAGLKFRFSVSRVEPELYVEWEKSACIFVVKQNWDNQNILHYIYF